MENVTTVHDLYATLLHILGLDHERLTYYHNGIERRLTDVHGHVIRDPRLSGTTLRGVNSPHGVWRHTGAFSSSGTSGGRERS